MRATGQFAKSASTPKTGLSALLAGPLRAQGRGASTPGLLSCICASLMVLAFLGASAAPAAASEGCSNEAIREEQGVFGTSLPDCRAYELVTPPDKGSGVPESQLSGETPEAERKPLQGGSLVGAFELGMESVSGAYAATDGNRVAWDSDPVPSSTSLGRNFLSTRGPTGWSSEDVLPTLGPQNALLCPDAFLGVQGPAYSPDLSKVVFELPGGHPVGFDYEENECGHDEPRLVPGEPEHLHNIFLHDNVTGANELVNVSPESESWFKWPVPVGSFENPPWPLFLAASEDFSHIVFEEEIKLTPDAPVGFPSVSSACHLGIAYGCEEGELYEWTGGKVSLVSYLPNGTPVAGRLASSTRGARAGQGEYANIARYRNAVSADGSRIFWEVRGGPESGLYLREGGTRTLRIDTAQPGAPGASGGGEFWWASTDGSHAFFIDESRLTANSTAAAEKPDLYEWRPDGTGGCAQAEGCVSDLTVNGGEAADVLGVSGASEDGAYVYFVAKGALTSQPNSEGQTATAGQPNLYLSHGGAIKFIATLEPPNSEDPRTGDEGDWDMQLPTAKVSANGLYLGFNSLRRVTKYDNTDAGNGKPDFEIYLYDAADERLSCASCLPSGERPSYGATLKYGEGSSSTWWTQRYPQHNVSNSGQVFFETNDALVARDTNRLRNVYEYEDGTVHLLSTGTSEEASHFIDATPSGSDVFITTSQPLVRKDTDSVFDYYDVRVDGGFPEPPPPPGCELEGCRGQATEAFPVSSPSTAQLEGPGDSTRLSCGAGLIGQNGKCVTKQSKQNKQRKSVHHNKKKHGRARRRHQKRHAKRARRRPARRGAHR
jgi:hypothetical protein